MIIRYSKHLLSLVTKGSPYYLSKEILKDKLNLKNKIKNNDVHIRSSIRWLLRAQQVNNDGGVSALYSLYDGWRESYSETTGYIISTLYNYTNQNNVPHINELILKMANWELTKQLPSGAFPGGAINNKEFPIVFNTGQVIFGMVRTYQETKDIKFKESAIKAADWLVKIQDKKGYWDKFTYLDKIHTYNTRVAWSLLRVYDIIKDEKYKNAAISNIEWALSQQIESGWFKLNAFHEDQEPLTHTIAYCIRGILECGIYLNNQNYIDQAKKPSDILLSKLRKDGSIQGSFNKNWNSAVSWSCLTGNSQIALIWLRLHSLTKDEKYLTGAMKLNNYVKSTQNLISKNKGIRGGIKGAFPIYGWYAPFCFTNWASKFFIDALMLENDLVVGNKLS